MKKSKRCLPTLSSANVRVNGAYRAYQRPREKEGSLRTQRKNRELRSGETLTQTPPAVSLRVSERSAAVLECERRIKYTITPAVCSPVRYLSWGTCVTWPELKHRLQFCSHRDLGIEWHFVIMDQMSRCVSPSFNCCTVYVYIDLYYLHRP